MYRVEYPGLDLAPIAFEVRVLNALIDSGSFTDSGRERSRLNSGSIVMTTFHQILCANTTGRDFVVGDLHGCLDLLQVELERCRFDHHRDRLFSVGDLIDRGPDSLGCLRLLREPWFYAVVGNHEDMLLSHFLLRDSDYHHPKDLLRNGGDWVMSLGADEEGELLNDLLPRVLAMPYVITVLGGPSTFHVAHAELMLTDEDICDNRLSSMAAAITWERRLIREVNAQAQCEKETPAGTLITSHQPWEPDLSLTFVGHTPLSALVMHRSHLFIDGGAFLRTGDARLHVVDVTDARSWINAESGNEPGTY